MDETMNKTDFWKNFKLGEELNVSGSFIYNGIRRFHELKILDYDDEVFEVFYYLSIGIERLMKIAIVFLEHDEAMDQEKFEKSLITHSHQELLGRIKQHVELGFGTPHNDLLALLTGFYGTLRYDRFTLNSAGKLGRERDALFAFLQKNLSVEFRDRSSMFANQNEDRYKQFIRRTVLKISSTLFKIIKEKARELGLYTYELRHGSKAETVFLGKADIPAENVLWKELLVFLMNTQSTSGYINFLRGIEPLEFDPALTEDYLDCFQSDGSKAFVMGELESLYEDLPNKSERLDMMGVIGSQGVYFPEDDEDDDIDFPDFDAGGDDMGEPPKEL